MTRYRDRYEEIYQLLTRAELQRGSQGLEELSLGPELFGHDPERWLGFYTRDGLRVALEKYGFFRDLQRLGFYEFDIEIRTSDPDEQLFRLHCTEPNVDEPLVELLVRRDFIRPQTPLDERVTDSHLPVLTVKWLLLQNPVEQFTADRPPLPGQRHPGLGVGAQVLEMLRNICHRLGLAGIANVPSYFHNALFYSDEFRHFDPLRQGAFLALCRDVMPALGNDITAASWALHWELVHNGDRDEPFRWFQELMVDPISRPLVDYFDDQAFHRETQKSLTAHNFTVDRRALERTLRRRGLDPFDPDRLSTWIGEQ